MFPWQDRFRPAQMVAVFEAEHEGHFRFVDVSPEVSAKRRFPLPLICGERDGKIPRRHSEAIFAVAIGPKELWLVPGASHERSIEVAPAELKRRVLAFLTLAQESD